jgi:hypothetical protein
MRITSTLNKNGNILPLKKNIKQTSLRPEVETYIKFSVPCWKQESVLFFFYGFCRAPLTVFPVSTLQVQTLFFFPLYSIEIDATISFKIWELGLFCLFLYFNYQLSLGFLIEIACLFDK